MTAKEAYNPYEVFDRSILTGTADDLAETFFAVPTEEGHTYDGVYNDAKIDEAITDTFSTSDVSSFIADPKIIILGGITARLDDNLRSPVWISPEQIAEASNLHEFRKAITTELGSNRLQRHYFQGIETVIGVAETKEDFEKIAQLYGYLYSESAGGEAKDVLNPGAFINRMIARALELDDDPIASVDGSADVNKAVDLVQPAAELVLLSVRDEADDERAANTNVSKGLLTAAAGAANIVAAARLRDRFDEKGLPGFDLTDASRELYRYSGDRFVTRKSVEWAIDTLHDEDRNQDRRQRDMEPRVSPARFAEVMYREAMYALERLGDENARIVQLRGAITQLASRQSAQVMPHTSFIAVANAVTKELNTMQPSGQKFSPLRPEDPVDVYPAFLRILQDADPELYRKAVATPMAENEPLRATSLYMEAQIQHRNYTTAAFGRLTVGDLVVVLRTQGLSDEYIRSRVNQMLASRRRNR